MAAKLLPGNKYFQTMQVGEKDFRNAWCPPSSGKLGGPSNARVAYVQKSSS